MGFLSHRMDIRTQDLEVQSPHLLFYLLKRVILLDIQELRFFQRLYVCTSPKTTVTELLLIKDSLVDCWYRILRSMAIRTVFLESRLN
jgi:hypothetical protein